MATFAGFAVIGVAFFQFGVGIAVDRASPWEAYLRTLPVGPSVRLGGTAPLGRVFAVAAAALLLVVTAVATTGARLPAARWARARSRRCSPAPCRSRSSGSRSATGRRRRGALPIANLLYLVLAYAGGLWIAAVRAFRAPSPRSRRFLPTRALSDALVAAGIGRAGRLAAPGSRSPASPRSSRPSPSPATAATKGGVSDVSSTGVRRLNEHGPPRFRTLRALALWEIIFVLVVLKIPVAYVGWVIWWAIKAEPEVGTEGGTDGVNWSPGGRRHRPRRPSSPRRGGLGALT